MENKKANVIAKGLEALPNNRSWESASKPEPHKRKNSDVFVYN